MSGQADAHEGCPLNACNTERQMEQRFNDNRLDLETLREFCEREGEAVVYRKGLLLHDGEKTSFGAQE